MIACRCLFRVDSHLACTFTYSYLNSKPFHQGQVCCLHSVNYKSIADKTTYNQDIMEQKRVKEIYSMWRPLCTQVTAVQECSKVYEAEDLHEMDVVEKAEASQVLENFEGTGSADQGNDEGKASKVGSLPSENNHSVSLQVGASLMRFFRGSTQRKIEEEMGVKLIFPASRQEDDLVIEGTSAESITKASERIRATIDEAVKSPNLDYSHFISLPLAIHPELVDKLVNFQKSILGADCLTERENVDSDANGATLAGENKDNELDKAPNITVELKVEQDEEHVKVDIAKIQRVSYTPKPKPAEQQASLSEMGIEKSIFIKPATFHLTVLMLKLWNKDRVTAAAEILQNIGPKVVEALDGRPITITLKGLECMKGSLARARVVYAPVEEIGREGRLERACQVIIDAFTDAGLVLEKDAQQKLKLHATVMNARHRKRKSNAKNVYSFDARGIFKQYGSEAWGEYLISEAHLSQRFVFDENGFYHRCASIPFPEACN